MKTLSHILPLGFLLACSDPTTATGPVRDAGNSDVVESADSGASIVLRAPVLDSVEKMHGGLHVMWTNTQPDCDAIEIERRLDADFALIFTVPDGSADNKHDGTVVGGKEYSYRVRCKKAVSYSPYSNELKGTP